MDSVSISQRRGEELAAQGYEIYLSPAEGVFVAVPDQATWSAIYKGGDKIEPLPEDAFRLDGEGRRPL
jgi:hypothetical protein